MRVDFNEFLACSQVATAACGGAFSGPWNHKLTNKILDSIMLLVNVKKWCSCLVQVAPFYMNVITPGRQ